MSLKSYKKDPTAILDYSINWGTWLGSDTISTSTWSAETGITVASSSNTTTVTTAWLSGGTAELDYTVTNRIVTAGGRTDERSLIIAVRER